MKIRFAVMLILISIATALWCQGPAPQQRAAELKQSIAENQAKLHKYQWIETIQFSLKGETKKTEQESCHYGPDGKVVKTPIGPPAAAPASPQRGLRGRVVQKKVGEIKDYMGELKELIGHYVPPDPSKLKTAMQAGKADMNASSGGVASLSFSDYYKPGDKLSFGFDSAAKKLKSFDVDTYLSDPKSDVVTLKNQFASLPDGTNYLQQTVLDSKGKQIQITATSSNYTPVSQ